MKATGPTNPITKKMIEDFRSQGYDQQNKFLLDLVKRLRRPERLRPVVNIAKLERLCKDGETILVPGKVLSYGNIRKKLTVSALAFSKAAKEKIEKAGGKVLTLRQLVKENPKGSKVRIMA